MRKLLFLAMLCPFLSMCQPITIKGKIINEEGEPVAGATITIKPANPPGNDQGQTPNPEHQTQNPQRQTASNAKGQFAIAGLRFNDTLVISAIGYATHTEVYDYTWQNHELTIVLTRKVSMLDEAVIIAYGTTTRRLNLSTVTTISAKEIATQPVSNPLAALQGRVPGLVVTQTNGLPGSAFNLQLRGRTSLDLSLSRNDPLIIIDGVPFEPGNLPSNLINSAAASPVATSTESAGGLSPLNSINPSDIESISVLKDAAATAIYGSRGANGVILITTKKALPGKIKTTVDLYTGLSQAIFKTAFLNTARYLQMRHEAFANDSLSPTASNAPDLLLWDTTRYTNFQKLLTGNTAHTSNVQASMTGGNATTRFTLGTGYHKETTVFSSQFVDARTSVHLNLSHSPASQKWSLSLSALWSADNNHLLRTDLTRYMALPPNLNLYNADGTLAWSDGGVSYASLGFSNPLAGLQQLYSSRTNNLSSGLLLNYKLLPFLTLRLNAGYNSFTTNERSATPKSAIDPNNSASASSAFANSTRNNWIIEPQAEFNQTKGKSNWQALLGTTFQHNEYSSTSINASGFTNDLLLYSIAAAGSVSVSNYNSLYRYKALFGRINYNWLQKYLLSFSARRDGSSRFSPGKRMAGFGAIAGGWVFSSEPFIQKALPFLSFGKLRSSYGITGNDQIGDYKYLDLWTVTTNPYQGIPGLRPSFLFNPVFEWEKNKKLEAAIDLGFWHNRLSVSAAWYRNRSSNQLINYLLPNQTGFASVVQNLPAVVQNSGWEVMANASILNTKNLQWKAAFNITLPSNKLVSFPGLAASSYNFMYVEGSPLSIQRKIKFLGVDKVTGLYAYEDFNKDGSISTPGDLQVLGDLDPLFYGGISSTVTWRRLTLDVFFQFTKQQGTNYLAYQYTAPAGFLYNQPSLALNRWQQPGDASPVQRYGATAASPVFLPSYLLSSSSGIYSDASFIRLKNCALAWQLSSRWLQKAKLQQVKLYAEAQNLLTITGYKGSDPETQNFYRLPPLQTIAFGIQLNF
ncbi:MAG: SusC/RagA family TonB-linked outer membrane protein [Flavisolibacter sp.]